MDIISDASQHNDVPKVPLLSPSRRRLLAQQQAHTLALGLDPNHGEGLDSGDKPTDNAFRDLVLLGDVLQPTVQEFNLCFKFKGRLGKGSFADVYKVQYRSGTLAMKVMMETVDPNGRSMFFNEAKVMRACRGHPQVVGFHALVKVPINTNQLKNKNVRWAILMDICDSGSIANKICNSMQSMFPASVYSKRQATEWCLALAQALTFLHTLEPPVAHRDVKSENLLLSMNGDKLEAKLSDFGLNVSMDFRRGPPVVLLRDASRPTSASSFRGSSSIGGGSFRAASPYTGAKGSRPVTANSISLDESASPPQSAIPQPSSARPSLHIQKIEEVVEGSESQSHTPRQQGETAAIPDINAFQVAHSLSSVCSIVSASDTASLQPTSSLGARGLPSNLASFRRLQELERAIHFSLMEGHMEVSTELSLSHGLPSWEPVDRISRPRTTSRQTPEPVHQAPFAGPPRHCLQNMPSEQVAQNERACIRLKMPDTMKHNGPGGMVFTQRHGQLKRSSSSGTGNRNSETGNRNSETASSLASQMLEGAFEGELRTLIEDEEFEFGFNLTGETGSVFYMAPEVYLKQPYNEKCDVFSFGMVMYELMCSLLLCIYYAADSDNPADVMETYPRTVAAGWRPPRPDKMSNRVWFLITACWDQDPTARPEMSAIVAELKGIVEDMEANPTAEDAAGGCCVIS